MFFSAPDSFTRQGAFSLNGSAGGSCKPVLHFLNLVKSEIRRALTHAKRPKIHVFTQLVSARSHDIVDCSLADAETLRSHLES